MYFTKEYASILAPSSACELRRPTQAYKIYFWILFLRHAQSIVAWDLLFLLQIYLV